MKKVLSILLASAMAAAPLSVNAFADNKSNCGIRNALEKIITVYGNTCGTQDEKDTSCGITQIISKLSQLGDFDLGCALTGECGNADNECMAGECGSSDTDCTDGCGENESAGSTDTSVNIKDWQDIFNNLPQFSQDSSSVITGGGNQAVQTPSSEIARVIELVNNYRIQQGLSAVQYDAQLSEAAEIRAAEQETVFSHTRPNGTSCFTALDECGVSYRGAGENIAMGQSSADEVMNDWMNSQGHRENILNGSFTKIGVGLHIGSDGRYYWAQMFIY